MPRYASSRALVSLLTRGSIRYHHEMWYSSRILSRYDMFAISIMTSMLGYVYGNENGRALLLHSSVHSHIVLEGDLSPWQSTGLKVAAPVGTLVGQLAFGYLGDILGRKRMCERFNQ
jgi:MFS family permease